MSYTVSGSIQFINDEEYVVDTVANRPAKTLAENIDLVSSGLNRLVGPEFRSPPAQNGWTYMRNIAAPDTHKVSIDKIDNAIGNRDFTDGIYLVDYETVTQSLNRLNVKLGTMSGIDVNYVNYLAQKAGLDKNTPISSADPNYGTQNNVANGDPLETAIGKLDGALGLRVYTEKSYLTNSQTLASSINLLEMATTTIVTVGDGTNSFGKYNSIESAASFLTSNSKKGTILVKRGTHSIATLPVSIPADVEIRGEGGAVIQYTASNTSAVLRLNGNNSIENITFDRGDIWNVYTLSSSPSALRNISMVFDEANFLHVAVHNITTSSIDYYKLKSIPDSSLFSVVSSKSGAAVTVNSTSPIRIKLTPWGEPYIFYVDGSSNLKWKRLGKGTSGPWSATPVTVLASVGRVDFDVDIDRWGYIHAAGVIAGNIYYATNVAQSAADSSTFNNGQLDAATGDGIAAVIDPWGNFHVVYRNSTTNTMYIYANYTGVSVSKSTPVAFSTPGGGEYGISMCIDNSTGTLHAFFKNASSTYLVWATKDVNATTFTVTNILAGNAIFPNCLIDASGALHVVTYTSNNKNVNHLVSFNQGTTWETVSVAQVTTNTVSVASNTNCALAVSKNDLSPVVALRNQATTDVVSICQRPPLFEFTGQRHRIIGNWFINGRIPWVSRSTMINSNMGDR